jgi:hypothetical protein
LTAPHRENGRKAHGLKKATWQGPHDGNVSSRARPQNCSQRRHLHLPLSPCGLWLWAVDCCAALAPPTGLYTYIHPLHSSTPPCPTPFSLSASQPLTVSLRSSLFNRCIYIRIRLSCFISLFTLYLYILILPRSIRRLIC